MIRSVISSVIRSPAASALGAGVGVSYTPTGTLMDGFESTSSWTDTFSSTRVASLDAEAAVQGDYAVRYDQGTAQFTSFNIHKDYASFDLQTLGTYAIYAVLDEDFDYQNISSVTVNVILNGTGTIYPGTSKTGLSLVQTGGVWLSGNLSQFNAAVQSASPGNHRFRLSTAQTAANAGSVTYDAFYRDVGGKGAVILTFDDVKGDQYTDAFPIMQANGLVGELYVPVDLVGTSTLLTWAQIAEMKAAGWSIQVNGTADDQPMTTAANPAAAVAILEAQKAELVSRGLGTPISFCYPFGTLRANGTRVEKTGVTTTAGSAVIPMASTTNITVGMRCIMFGVSRDARVASIDPNVSVTLDETVTTAISSKTASFVDDSGAFHGTKLQDAIEAAGWKWGRSTINGNMFCLYGVSRAQALQYPSYPTSSLTLETFQTHVNTAIAAKAVTSFYFHSLADAGIFEDCMEWLKAQVDAGLVDVTTTPALEARYGAASPPA